MIDNNTQHLYGKERLFIRTAQTRCKMKHCSVWLASVMVGAVMLSSTALGVPYNSPGNFYAGNGSLGEYDADGIYLRSLGVPGAKDVVIDVDSGKLIALAGSAGAFDIWVIDALPNPLAPHKANFFFGNGLQDPTSMAYRNDRLYVADFQLNAVVELGGLEADYAVVWRMDIGLGNIPNPGGLVFDSSGQLFVSSSGGSGQIVVFNSGFVHQRTMDIAGLQNPGALEFDSNGNLYVLSKGSNTVMRVDPISGAPTGTGPFAPSHLNLQNAAGISLSEYNNRLLVADEFNGVFVFNLSTGEYIDTYSIGGGGVTGIAAVVPEPATLALAGIAFGALAFRRRKRNNKG